MEQEKSFQVASVQGESSCPVSMPGIRSAILFQSVEAPQIEPMKEQANIPYDNYDLVMGKPSGVLVHVDRANMDKNKDFRLALYVNGEKSWRYDCFHQPDKAMEKGQEQDCFFNLSGLESLGDFKFFPFSQNEWFLSRELKNLLIRISLYPVGYENYSPCLVESSFHLNVIKTGALKIGWTRLSPRKNCGAYDSISIQKVMDFVDSEEMDYIFSMFPIDGLSSSISEDKLQGSCNSRLSEQIPKQTIGLLLDIKKLDDFRSDKGYHKIFAIVPRDYFVFHKKLNDEGETPAGLVIRPVLESLDLSDAFKFNWVRDLLGGSWNAAIVREDQLNQGTVAHELAHTLGQSREYYEQQNRTEYCRPFKGDFYKLCHKYQIPRALRFWENKGTMFLEIVKNRWSIMNSKGSIETQWMDRETHQKAFWTLSKYGAEVDPEIDLFGETDSFRSRGRKGKKSPFPRSKKKRKAIVISTLYHSKTDRLIMSKIRVRKTDLKTPSFYPRTENTKLPVLFFQLWRGKSLLDEIKRPILKMEMELLFQKGPSKKVPFGFSPLRAVFDWPEGAEMDKLKLVVLNPQRERIRSFKMPKRKKIKNKKNTQKRKKVEKKRKK